MKRTLFYLAIILQIAFLSLLAFQHSIIDRYGEEITLSTHRDYGGHFGWVDHQGKLMVNLDIEKIAEDKWLVDPEKLNYNDKIFAILQEDEDGFHGVKEASNKQLKVKEGEVLLVGSFLYKDEDVYDVDFQLENIQPDLHQSIDHRNPFSVTIKVAPWGQRKVTKLDKIKN